MKSQEIVIKRLAYELKAKQVESEASRSETPVATMRGATHKMIKQGIDKSALQTGDEIPSFVLPNANSNAVSVDDLLTK